MRGIVLIVLGILVWAAGIVMCATLTPEPRWTWAILAAVGPVFVLVMVGVAILMWGTAQEERERAVHEKRLLPRDAHRLGKVR